MRSMEVWWHARYHARDCTSRGLFKKNGRSSEEPLGFRRLLTFRMNSKTTNGSYLGCVPYLSTQTAIAPFGCQSAFLHKRQMMLGSSRVNLGRTEAGLSFQPPCQLSKWSVMIPCTRPVRYGIIC